MIRLLPHKTETLVVAHSCNMILHRLAVEFQRIPRQGHGLPLTGWVNDDTFELTLRVRRFNVFMPRIKGRVESTSKGCILFLKYTLLPANQLFLSFWTFFLIVMGIMLIVFNDELLGNACILLVFLIHGVAWSNFQLHLKNARRVFLESIE